MVFAGLILVTVFALLAALTFAGQRRRGRGPASAVAAGIFFPVTWAVWYIHDEDPYRVVHR